MIMRPLARRFSVALGVLTLTVGGSALIASPAQAGTPMPAHVYAPYFETWTTDSLTTIAQESGAHYLTMAFLEVPSKNSCVPAWNGDASEPASGGLYLSDITSLRAIGGDVIPSFGGFSADNGGTELADACTNVNSIAAAYESVITTYDVTRLDMDVEAKSLNNAAGIDRRNKAIALVEAWATAQGRPLQISYTLPVEPAGLESNGLAVLQNAVANNARVDVVNIMTFDYYDKTTTDMAAAAISAAQGLHAQLATLYPTKTSAELWAMEGNTILPGIDDYPKKTEVTSVADAQALVAFAQANGIGTLSIWAIERDNGGCPGKTDENDCSGIVQSTWAFSQVLDAYTGS